MHFFVGRRWREFFRYVSAGSQTNIYVYKNMILFCVEIMYRRCSVLGASNAGDIDYAKNSIEAPYFIDSGERI